MAVPLINLRDNCKCQGPHSCASSYAVLHRDTGDRLVKATVEKTNKRSCLNRMIKWIKTANVTLEIVNFSVMHKRIISALAQRSLDGVKCRVVLYRHWFFGFKVRKHEKYLKRLKKSGVEVRYASDDDAPPSFFRMVFIDCFDRSYYPPNMFNEGAYIYGDQRDTPRPLEITKDYDDLTVKKAPLYRTSWIQQFDQIWNAVYSELKVLPATVAGPSGL